MSAEYYLEQAEACRLERHRLEKYDSFFKFICISFEHNRISYIIGLYDKACSLYLDKQNTVSAAQCAYESGYLCQYLRDYNKAACRYVDSAHYYYKSGGHQSDVNRICEMTLKMIPLLDFKTKAHVDVECMHLMACLCYDEGDYNGCMEWLTRISFANKTEQVIKIYEKMVFLYVVKMGKPGLAITICEEIIRRSKVHAEFYRMLKEKLMEKKMDESCKMLQKLSP